MRNFSSKSFDALNDKNTIEYESINPEEFTSMFLDKNEGINQILNVLEENRLILILKLCSIHKKIFLSSFISCLRSIPVTVSLCSYLIIYLFIY